MNESGISPGILIALFASVSLLLGFFAAAFFYNRRKDGLGDSAADSDKESLILQERLNQFEKQLQEKESALQAATEQLATLNEENKDLLAKKEHSRSSAETFEKQLEESRVEHKELDVRITELRAENEKLKTMLAEKETRYEEQLKELKSFRDDMTDKFQNIANEILEVKGKTFAEQSKTSLSDLLKPFREQIGQFREKVEAVHIEDVKSRADLKSELKHLQELNKKITEEAHDLSTALRGQKKMQGNWGEMILENILDHSGLKQGKDYRREVSTQTDEGRKRPDVIVYLPDEKHLVIDAKVSLNSYTSYVNEEDEAKRAASLAAHVKAVSERMNELSSKNYFDLPNINSPEMVFMFIPIESAFVEAVRADETLFQRAIDKNILIATPTTLLTSLNIVRQLWRFENQNKHTAAIAIKAGKIHDKLKNFIETMEMHGRQLGTAQASYEKAFSQFYTGKANLVQQINEFKQLGVSVKGELPKHIVDKAALELDQDPTIRIVDEEAG